MFETSRDFINEINKINTDNNNKFYIKQLNAVKEIISGIYNETKKLIKYYQTYLNKIQKYKLQKDIEENIKYLKKNNLIIYMKKVFFISKKKSSNNIMNIFLNYIKIII